MDYAGVDILPAADARHAAGDRGQRRRGLAGPAARDAASTSPARSSTTCWTAGLALRARRAPSVHDCGDGASSSPGLLPATPAGSTSRCASLATSAWSRRATAWTRDCSSPARKRPLPGRCSSRAQRVGHTHRGSGGRQPGGGRLQHQPRHRAAVCARSPRPSSVRMGHAAARKQLRAAVVAVLADLDRGRCARAAYRAIALANPAAWAARQRRTSGASPSIDLRSRDGAGRRPRQHRARNTRTATPDLFDLALPVATIAGMHRCGSTPPWRRPDCRGACSAPTCCCSAVWPDSHIVRKHGEAVAQHVMRVRRRHLAGVRSQTTTAQFAAWDESLKA